MRSAACNNAALWPSVTSAAPVLMGMGQRSHRIQRVLTIDLLVLVHGLSRVTHNPGHWMSCKLHRSQATFTRLWWRPVASSEQHQHINMTRNLSFISRTDHRRTFCWVSQIVYNIRYNPALIKIKYNKINTSNINYKLKYICAFVALNVPQQKPSTVPAAAPLLLLPINWGGGLAYNGEGIMPDPPPPPSAPLLHPVIYPPSQGATWTPPSLWPWWFWANWRFGNFPSTSSLSFSGPLPELLQSLDYTTVNTPERHSLHIIY